MRVSASLCYFKHLVCGLVLKFIIFRPLNRRQIIFAVNNEVTAQSVTQHFQQESLLVAFVLTRPLLIIKETNSHLWHKKLTHPHPIRNHRQRKPALLSHALMKVQFPLPKGNLVS